LGAAASWAIGTVIQKRDWNTPILTLIGWQLVFGTIPLAILAVTFDTAPFANLTLRGVLAVSHIVLIACLFGYWAWFNVVKLVPTSVASIAVLTVPLVGVMSSALILGESIGVAELVALVLITCALATIMLGPIGRSS
jgi:drug/metabolite transporter (DMT)-like permease